MNRKSIEVKWPNIKVAGSSLTISTNTKINAVIIVVFIIGKCTLVTASRLDKPNDLIVKSIFF
ncbi:MAG: hypothetical protein CM15mP69_0010 [Ectothiorhodospiraceae bacterium]|nr:MAG: hypothetical protein CM15mP69_0010 [Ectothiorhodospiraceae bacterium]